MSQCVSQVKQSKAAAALRWVGKYALLNRYLDRATFTCSVLGHVYSTVAEFTSSNTLYRQQSLNYLFGHL